jgi:hypothetical protein
MPRREQSTQSKKPADTAFKQQRLPAWQPILSPPWVISCFFLVAFVFIPIGVLVILASNQVVEMEQRYDNLALGNAGKIDYTVGGNTYLNSGRGRTFVRWLNMGAVPEDMEAPIYVYYKLSNFYQNHRRYARSRSDAQLAGDEVKYASLTDCAPMRYPGEIQNQEKKNPAISDLYAPCGLIAWSMFNDSFLLYRSSSTANCSENNVGTANGCTLLCGADFGQKANVATLGNCTKDGIAWASDKDKKFKTPAAGYIQSWENNQTYYYQEGPYTTTAGTGFREGHVMPLQTDEDFMVWMRTASLPTFRKLWRIIPEESGISLKKGENLWVRVVDRFNTDDFKGEKSFVISTTTWIGGKNYFLGIAYLVVGCICFLLAIVFVVKHLTTRNSAAQNPPS